MGTGLSNRQDTTHNNQHRVTHCGQLRERIQADTKKQATWLTRGQVWYMMQKQPISRNKRHDNNQVLAQVELIPKTITELKSLTGKLGNNLTLGN